LKPVRPEFPHDASEDEIEQVAAHFDHLNRALNDGRLLFAGRTTGDKPYGLIMLRAKSFEEAKKFLDEDPAIQGGVFEADLQGFRIALMHEFLAAQREMEATMQRNRGL
jgi:uncharacterized protein YciI